MGDEKVREKPIGDEEGWGKNKRDKEVREMKRRGERESI